MGMAAQGRSKLVIIHESTIHNHNNTLLLFCGFGGCCPSCTQELAQQSRTTNHLKVAITGDALIHSLDDQCECASLFQMKALVEAVWLCSPLSGRKLGIHTLQILPVFGGCPFCRIRVRFIPDLRQIHAATYVYGIAPCC